MKSDVLPPGKVTQPPGTSVSLEKNKPIDSVAITKRNVLLSDFKSRAFTFGQPKIETHCVRKGYVSLYDHRLKIPYCVMEYLTASKEQFDDSINRRNKKFVQDSSVPEPFRSANSDYEGSHYERGHMATAQNHRHDQEAHQDTFFLSNISPQIRHFNRSIWKKLEEKVKHFVKNYENVYVCTGPLFLPKENPDGRSSVSYEVIGKNRVAVPTHYFKVILGETKDGEFHMESYVIEHTDVEKIVPLNSFLVKKEFIEKNAGFLIFNDLPADELGKINRFKSKL